MNDYDFKCYRTFSEVCELLEERSEQAFPGFPIYFEKREDSLLIAVADRPWLNRVLSHVGPNQYVIQLGPGSSWVYWFWSRMIRLLPNRKECEDLLRIPDEVDYIEYLKNEGAIAPSQEQIDNAVEEALEFGYPLVQMDFVDSELDEDDFYD